MHGHPPKNSLGRTGAARRISSILLGCLLGITAPAFATIEGAQIDEPALPSGELIWKKGGVIGGSWTVTGISRHPEYVRFQVTGPEGKGGLEITTSQGDEDPWSTASYRVQPSPGAKASEPLVRAALKELMDWERSEGHTPFVSVVSVPGPAPNVSAGAPGAEMPPERAPPERPRAPQLPDVAWVVLLVLGLVLAGVCLFKGMESAPGSAQNLTSLLRSGALMAGLLCLAVLHPAAVPVDWITVLHEGSADRLVGALWGEGNHGPMWTGLVSMMTPEGTLPIRAAVSLNLALHVMNTVGLGIAGYILTRRIVAGGVAALVYGITPALLNSALSELPSELLTTCLLIGLSGLLAYPSRRSLGRLCLMVAAIMAVTTRKEMALAVALMVGGWEMWFIASKTAGRRAVPVILGISGMVAAMVAANFALGPGTGDYALAALSPWDPAGLGVLAMVLIALPIGALPLGVWGWLVALRRSAPMAIAAAGVVVFGRMYTTAAHDAEAPFEMLRYGTMVLPVWILLVAVGWTALQDRLRSDERLGPLSLTAASRRGLLMVAAVSLLIPWPSMMLAPLLENDEGTLATPWEVPLTWDQQEEARLLLTLVESQPDCVVVTTGAHDPMRGVPIASWEHIYFGGNLDRPLTLSRQAGALIERVRPMIGEDTCLLYYRGLDCAIEGGVDCGDEVGSRLPTGTRSLTDRAYYTHVRRATPVQTGVYGLGP